MEGALHVIHTSVRSTLTFVAHNEDPHGLACASFLPVSSELSGTDSDFDYPIGRLSTGYVHVWVRLLGTFKFTDWPLR